MDSYSTGLGDNALRGSMTSASTIDRLQSTLKQREGELHNIQVCMIVQFSEMLSISIGISNVIGKISRDTS